MSEEHVIIIGNGISGITLARHIRKLSDKKITVISNETEHFFSRTALMYIYMGHMKFEHTKPYEDWFWEKNKISLKKGYVQSIDTTSKSLVFQNNEILEYDKLILATGSKPNKFGWPGENLKGVQGLYHLQDLTTLEKYASNNQVCERAVVVGGGLIGIELVEMLISRNIPVTFLVREKSFWGSVLPPRESEMLNRHIKDHHVDLRLGVNLKEIKGDQNGAVKSIVIEETNEDIACNLVGLTAGVSPNIEFVTSSDIATNRGILVNRFLETNVPEVYAIGDCAEQQEPIGKRKAIEAVWYTGRMMGETLAHTICGNRTAYNPSHWFNSAKFLDIEYQTYGWVNPTPLEKNRHFHWMHKDQSKCITIEYNQSTGEINGINTFGIRLRHDVFDQWLTEKQDIDFVLKNLGKANFDPEFYARYEGDILEKYNLDLASV